MSNENTRLGRQIGLALIKEAMFPGMMAPPQLTEPDNTRYTIGGATGGALAGGAAGAGLGDLIAGQTKRHVLNIPIPGTQRVENAQGRLIGGALGAALGGAGGYLAGDDYGDEQERKIRNTLQDQMLTRLLRAQGQG